MKKKAPIDPFIEIVIPNWNGAPMLSHCLRSLHNQGYKDFSITVVDNGSTDNSLDMLAEEFPAVKVIEIDHNSGFSVAVNRGIENSNGAWILLLNNDMEVAPDCLEKLAENVNRYVDCDFFAVKMMSYQHRDTIDGAGDAVLRGGVGYRLGTMEKDSDRFKKNRKTFGACAGAALYKRSFFTTVGLFDSDFFAYLEDVDLNFRAARLGLRCMFLSDAVVYHIGSATTGSKFNEMTIRLSTRNNINLLIKNYPLSLLFRFFFPLVIYQLMWLLFCLKKRMLKPYLQGILESIRTVPVFYRKRRFILAGNSNLTNKQLGDMISSAEKEAVESIMARRTERGKSNLLLACYTRMFF